MKLLHLLLITSTSMKIKLHTSVRAHTCVKGVGGVGVVFCITYMMSLQ